MSRGWRSLGIVLVACITGACTTAGKMLEVERSASKAESRVRTLHDIFAQTLTDRSARRRAQYVRRPWIAGRAVPLAREVTLPLALRARVDTTFMFAEAQLDLQGVAQRITAVTAIPVYVSPEALLPLERFLPRLADSLNKAATTTAPPTVRLSGGPEPLARILDRICARLGISWRYVNGRIEFYRTETRVFNVRALTLNAQAEASLGLSGDKKSAGFSSSSKTSLSGGKYELLTAIRIRLEPFLSESGVLAGEPGASSSIVVTDTPAALERIGQYLEQENLALTRRIRLVFEEITLVTTDTADAGLDWNLVFSSARAAAVIAMPGPSLAGSGSLNAALNHGPFKGSEAVVKALSQIGRVVRRSSVPILTLNRRPITHAVRTTFSYIDKVQTTALPTGTSMALGLPSVSVSQKDETVGSLLTLLPDAQDDGQILLSVAYDNTVAQPLKSVTFGDKSNPLQLQQITIDGNGTVQQVAVQPGQPLVISGFDRSHDESEGRRLNPGLPLLLGGSDHATRQRLTTIVIVTAQVEEGF